MNARILIVTGCGNSGDQYIPCMNTFFTAQKQVRRRTEIKLRRKKKKKNKQKVDPC